jgi:hypothetical protein
LIKEIIPLASKTIAKPIIAQRIILLAVRIFSGSPPEVKNKNPAIIIIIGKMAAAIQKMKLMRSSINSSKLLAFRGFTIFIHVNGDETGQSGSSLLLHPIPQQPLPPWHPQSGSWATVQPVGQMVSQPPQAGGGIQQHGVGDTQSKGLLLQ